MVFFVVLYWFAFKFLFKFYRAFYTFPTPIAVMKVRLLYWAAVSIMWGRSIELTL